MKIKYVIILLVFLCIFSCENSTDVDNSNSNRRIQKAFVGDYIYPKSIILDYVIDREGDIVIMINTTGVVYSQHSSNTSESYESYWKYANQYGDTTYNSGSPPFPIACYTKLHHIDIVCDKDYDENHKALASLGDITEYSSKSYRDYIQSFYKSGDMLITKLLSEMNGDDYLFLDADGSMTLRIEGSKKLQQGEYKFTIIFVTEDNKTVKNDITIVK